MKKVEKTTSFKGSLLEIVIIIGVFAIMSIYIMRMFMAADRLQSDAVITSKAVVHAESIAEVWKGTQGETIQDAKEKFVTMVSLIRSSQFDTADTEAYIIYFDKDWNVIDQAGSYAVLVSFHTNSLNETKGLLTGNVQVYKTTKQEDSFQLSKEYCNLEVSNYIGK